MSARNRVKTAHSDFLRALVYHRAWVAGRDAAPSLQPPSMPSAAVVRKRMNRHTATANLDSMLIRNGLTRQRVERHYRETPEDYLDGRFKVFLSAGKTGQLNLFLYDRRMWCQYLASFLRAFKLAGTELRAKDRILFVGSSHPAHTLPRVAAAFPASCVRVAGMQEGLEPAVQTALQFRPTLLIGYSSALSMLAAATYSSGLKPRCVLAGTDALLDQDRCLLEAAWGVTPRLFYSTTETGMLASQCAHNRLHIYHDLVDCEIEDETLLVTPRINSAQRLIRYHLPGRFALGEPCPHHPGPTLELLDNGRIVKPFTVRDHRDAVKTVHPIVVRTALDPLGVSLAAPPQAQHGGLLVEIDPGHRSIPEVRQALLHSLARAEVIMDPARIRIRQASPKV